MENSYNKDIIDYSALEYISGSDLLRLTIAIMLADGIIDPNEVDLIKKIARLKYMSEKEVHKYIEEMQAMEDPINYAIDTSTMNLDENILMVLMEIAASDGEIAETEVKVLQKFGELLEISSKKFNTMLQKVYQKRMEYK